GIVGLRLFKNPKFTGSAVKKWDAKRYYDDPKYYSDPNLVRPYRIGMSCAFCHTSAHPLNPPLDPASPRWENLSGAIGSQYLRIRGVFGNLLSTNNFIYHLLDSQLPGTIDTSLIASDNINNPNAMNAIFAVPQRVQRAMANPKELLTGASAAMPVLDKAEPQPYANPRLVPRILFDGADSVGIWGALARVYLNIGTFHEQWIRLHEPLIGFLPPKAATTREDRQRSQMPFKIEDCAKHSVYWQATRLRVEALRDYFLKITPSMPLLDAKGGGDADVSLAGYSPASRVKASELARGRRVFAQNCIVCHSSIQPESNANDLFESDPIDLFHQKPEPPEIAARMRAYEERHGDIITKRRQKLAESAASGEFWDHDPGQWLRDEAYRAWALEVIEMPEFWRQNFLSTDYRVPVSYIGTNPGRALGNNATAGHMWEDFSSDSYKKMPSVGSMPFFNPYKGTNGEHDLFTPRHRVAEGTPPGGGGVGFYRPPPLISIWATAPLLHNNSLGLFNNDPSVNGRLAAFEDAMQKLLWPERRHENTNLNSATPERLRRDHGLIWRTPCDTYLSIPGKHLPAFARRLPWPKTLQRLTDTLDGLGSWRAAPSIGLFALAFLLLANWGGRSRVGRLQRLAAYASLGSALLIGFLAYFVSGGFGDLRLGPIPAGTPVNLLANMNPDAGSAKLRAALGTTFRGLTEIHTRHLDDDAKSDVLRRKVAPALLEVNKCPDFVMDKGHYFPWFRDMTDEDKRALIELLKTF
ncbi:MAG: hypothetical protein L0Z50_37595, partial [Verrucomicrobiales bacterium]|nr:hypothetical protein [Verrucomicrobiales bacterium]